VPLASRRNVVVGGGSGIGRAAAVALAQAGSEVFVLGRRQAMLGETAQLARELPGCVTPITCDVLDERSVDDAFAAIEASGGPAAGLAHCAAAVNYTPAAEMTPRGFRAVVESVLFGAFNVLHRWSAPLIAAREPGAAVFVTSHVAALGTPGASHSSAGKAGVEAMVKTIAREWGPLGIRLNVMGPGIFPVERNAELVHRPEYEAAVVPLIALGRLGELPEAVGPLLFLLSEAASYITGEVIVSDGGFRLTPEFLPRWSYPTGVPID
jgi:NAD(P)-dependent dehydrogenase (short-subunit alcohol dehydrogenase family)